MSGTSVLAGPAKLYIGGEFIGGADILTEMYESGELQKIIPQEAQA